MSASSGSPQAPSAADLLQQAVSSSSLAPRNNRESVESTSRISVGGRHKGFARTNSSLSERYSAQASDISRKSGVKSAIKGKRASIEITTINVTIDYGSERSHHADAQKVQKELYSEFSDDVNVMLTKHPDKTGMMEIKVGTSLVHSQSTRGHTGHVTIDELGSLKQVVTAQIKKLKTDKEERAREKEEENAAAAKKHSSMESVDRQSHFAGSEPSSRFNSGEGATAKFGSKFGSMQSGMNSDSDSLPSNFNNDAYEALEYLDQNGIPYLLKRLIKELVENKPADPLHKIVTWLVSRCQLREMLEEGVIPYNLSDEEAAKCLRAPPDDALWGRFMTDEALWDDIAELGFDRARAEEMQWVFGEYADVETGTVTLADIRRILQALNQQPSQKKLAEAFTRLDQDHSGRLDFLEFLSLTQMIDPDAIPKTVIELGIDQEQFVEIKIAFEEADVSNLHFIDEKQLRSVLESLDIKIPQKVLREKFKNADEDGSGKIDLSEFLKLVASVDKNAEENLCESLGMQMSELESLRAAFEESSSDIGLVNFDEVKRVLAQMDQSPSMKQLRKGFKTRVGVVRSTALDTN